MAGNHIPPRLHEVLPDGAQKSRVQIVFSARGLGCGHGDTVRVAIRGHPADAQQLVRRLHHPVAARPLEEAKGIVGGGELHIQFGNQFLRVDALVQQDANASAALRVVERDDFSGLQFLGGGQEVPGGNPALFPNFVLSGVERRFHLFFGQAGRRDDNLPGFQLADIAGQLGERNGDLALCVGHGDGHLPVAQCRGVVALLAADARDNAVHRAVPAEEGNLRARLETEEGVVNGMEVLFGAGYEISAAFLILHLGGPFFDEGFRIGVQCVTQPLMAGHALCDKFVNLFGRVRLAEHLHIEFLKVRGFREGGLRVHAVLLRRQLDAAYQLGVEGQCLRFQPRAAHGFRHGDGVGVFLLQKSVELFLFLDGQDGDAPRDLLHGVFDVAGFLDGVAQLLVELGVVPQDLNCGHIAVLVQEVRDVLERLRALSVCRGVRVERGHLFAEHGGRALLARHVRDEELVGRGCYLSGAEHAAKRLHEHVDVQFRLDDDHVPLFLVGEVLRGVQRDAGRTGLVDDERVQLAAVEPVYDVDIVARSGFALAVLLLPVAVVDGVRAPRDFVGPDAALAQPVENPVDGRNGQVGEVGLLDGVLRLVVGAERFRGKLVVREVDGILFLRSGLVHGDGAGLVQIPQKHVFPRQVDGIPVLQPVGAGAFADERPHRIRHGDDGLLAALHGSGRRLDSGVGLHRQGVLADEVVHDGRKARAVHPLLADASISEHGFAGTGELLLDVFDVPFGVR